MYLKLFSDVNNSCAKLTYTSIAEKGFGIPLIHHYTLPCEANCCCGQYFFRVIVTEDSANVVATYADMYMCRKLAEVFEM